MGHFTILILTFGFTLFVLRFYYYQDKFIKRPMIYLIIALIMGMIACLIIISASLIIFIFLPNIWAIVWLSNVEQSGFFLIFLGPIIEESLKTSFLLILHNRLKFKSPLEGMIFGAMIGCGFGLIENLYFGLSTLIFSGFVDALTLTIIRGSFLIVGHPFYTGLIGAGIIYHKIGLSESRYQYFFQSCTLHICWNFAALARLVFQNIDFISNLILVFTVFTISLIYLYRQLVIVNRIEHGLNDQGFYSNPRDYTVQMLR
jgi:RsiW-degrading membrane proteinase PrsW (M82 family)